MMDAHAIDSVERLREVIGAEIPGVAAKNIDRLDRFAIDFLARSPLLILSTSDAQGNQDASPKGDAPGFVEVVDDKTILVPDRPGNKLAYGHLNILQNPKVGLLFLIPGTKETLRINGDAELTSDPQLLAQMTARGKPAVLVMRVRVREVFFHCAKAFVRSRCWQPDSWGEPHKVSFGEMFAARHGGDRDMVEQIEQRIAEDVRDNL